MGVKLAILCHLQVDSRIAIYGGHCGKPNALKKQKAALCSLLVFILFFSQRDKSRDY
jgi:hypothetical protein